MPRVQRGKVSATFETRKAAGCGFLRLLRALSGTRILQAAAPTAPPCFGRWPRSSPLQTKGCSPLIIPKQLGSIQKIQAATLKDFLCYADLESLARRNVKATACFHADANAPAGSQRQHMPFPVTTLPVKMRLERSAERDKRELVGARPLHLADARPFGRLTAPLGLSLFRFASQTRIYKIIFPLILPKRTRRQF